MSNSATEIANLLYRYAELMDGGELEAVAEMFRHARMKSRSAGELLDNAGMLEQWRRFVKIYPCGTPRTKHVVTNPIIEVDAGRTVDVVFTKGFSLEAEAAGGAPDTYTDIWRRGTEVQKKPLEPYSPN